MNGERDTQGRWTWRRVLITLLVIAFAAVCIWAYSVLASKTQQANLNRWDSTAYNFFVLRLRRPWLTPIMEGFSALASPVVLAAMLLAVAAFAPGQRPGWCAGTNLVLSVVLNTLLKEVIQRPRPEGYNIVAETGYSFPSGHSMVSMAFYGLLAWLVWKYETNQVERHVYPVLFVGLIVMVGVSRIYLGVHYLTDVLAGLLVSTVWLILYITFVVPLFLPDTAGRHTRRGRLRPRPTPKDVQADN